MSEPGTTHPYMLSVAGCWARYGEILAQEYSDPALRTTHRLSVDAYAAQHPGAGDRRAIQSVGLHLARLMVQLDNPLPPRETNEVMLGLSKAKSSIPFLEPPSYFAITVADVPLNASVDIHIAAVQAWAAETWAAWSNHHEFVRLWVRNAGWHR